MATVQVFITNTADDVQEAVGIALDTSSVVAGFVADFSAVFAAGVRFRAVTGPVTGAIVNSATLTLETVIFGTPNTTIYGVDVDDAAVWSDPGNLPSAATRTTASVAGPTAAGTQVIDVTAIVQEILNRAGWVSGNDMAFVGIDNAGSGDNYWIADDLDDVGGNEAILDIDYTNSGAVTVEPGVASLTTTRFAPTVLTPRTVTPGVLSLVTAGQAPTVLTPRVAVPGVVALSTSLFAPTVQTPRTVSPGVLSLVTAGQTPTVLTPRVVAPGVLALTTSGQAPTVTTGGNVAVEPGLAELVTSLFAPTVLTPRVVEPGVLSLTTSGQAPTVLTPRTVTPGVLALVTSLFAPSVATPRVVTPGAAALVLTAFAPVLLLPRVVTPGVAALTLTAFVPVVSNGEVILVPGTVVVFDKPAGSVLIQDWAPEAAVRDALAGHLLVGDGP